MTEETDLLKTLAAGPLADPNRINLPRGRRKGANKRTPAELELFRAERAAKAERLDRESEDHRAQLFRYYAATDVPIVEVAAIMGIDEGRARSGLAKHGRETR